MNITSARAPVGVGQRLWDRLVTLVDSLFRKELYLRTMIAFSVVLLAGPCVDYLPVATPELLNSAILRITSLRSEHFSYCLHCRSNV